MHTLVCASEAARVLIVVPASAIHVWEREVGKFVKPPAVHRGLALTARRRDGTEVPLEITVSASEYAGVRQVIVVARDVTERHRADRAVADLERYAVTLDPAALEPHAAHHRLDRLLRLRELAPH